MARDSLPQSCREREAGRNGSCLCWCERSHADVHAFTCLYGNLNQQNLSRLARPAPELFKMRWMKPRSPGGSARPWLRQKGGN